jgi:hypothetical protein
MRISTIVVAKIQVFSLGCDDSCPDMDESTLIVEDNWQQS